MIGTTIGNYRIVEKLGDGGMGAVYRAVDEMLDREVAIKVLRPELVRQATLIERFRQEAIALARLNHPRIATLHGLERSGDSFLMIMEYVRGDTLEAIVQRSGRLQWSRAAELTSAVLDALDHAHDRGVVHRDIKPANIMLAHNGAVKVMDFGIARVLGKSRQTQFGHAVGTPTYMAPEQLRGEEVDGRTDLYAVGAVLFELVTGHMAFEADSDYSLMMKQLNEPPPAASSIVSDVPAVIDQIIQRAMSKKREDRFPHANAFREALDRTIGGRAGPSHRVVAPRTRLVEESQAPNVPVTPDETAEHGVVPPPVVAETRLVSSTPVPVSLPVPPSAGAGAAETRLVSEPRAAETRLASEPRAAETRLASEPRVAETRLASESAAPATRLAGAVAVAPGGAVVGPGGVPLSKDWRTYVAAAAVLLAVGTAVRTFGATPAERVLADTTQVAANPVDPQPPPAQVVEQKPRESVSSVPAASANVAVPVLGSGSSIPRPTPPASTPSESGRKKGATPPPTTSETRPEPKPDTAPSAPERVVSKAPDRAASEETSAEGVHNALQSFAGGVREKRAEVGSALRGDGNVSTKWAELVREGRLSMRVEGAPEVDASGTHATATFNASLTVRSPFGATKEQKARFSAELARSGGEWRVVSVRPLGELNLK